MSENPGGIRDVVLKDVDLSIEKWSKWPGGWRDLRPALGGEQRGLARSMTSAVHLERVERVALDGVRVAWAEDLPDDYTVALTVRESTDVDRSGLTGASAPPRGAGHAP